MSRWRDLPGGTDSNGQHDEPVVANTVDHGPVTQEGPTWTSVQLPAPPSSGVAGEAVQVVPNQHCSTSGSFTLTVVSPEFKFGCAHFIAHPGKRERLHGHNYVVRIRVKGPVVDGYVIDFSELKQAACAECRLLNEYLLIPARCSSLVIKNTGGQVDIHTEDGSYFSFPEKDCVLLPIAATSAEELAALLWFRLEQRLQLRSRGIHWMEVEVWERAIQAAAFSRNLDEPRAKL